MKPLGLREGTRELLAMRVRQAHRQWLQHAFNLTVGTDAYLGHSSSKALPESSAGGTSGGARNLVGAGKRQEGLCAASGDLAVEGKVKALYGRHELLVIEMIKRGYRHRSLLAKPHATGAGQPRTFVDPPREQARILRNKRCHCDV